MDLRSLVIYTRLPEMFDHYLNMINMSIITENGYSFSGCQAYIDSVNIDYDAKMFWELMNYFLSVHNSLFRQKVRHKSKEK